MRKRTYFRAAVLLAPLLAGCYAGLGHMLEEDYNPRFTVTPPTVQAPAPQPQQPTPQQPQQPQQPPVQMPPELDLLPGEYQVPLYSIMLSTGAGLAADYGNGEAKWEFIFQQPNRISYDTPDYTATNGNTITNGNLKLYRYSGFEASDLPIIITLTVTMEDGTVFKDTTKVVPW